MPRIALLDDYQSVAMTMADWGNLPANCEVQAFHDHLKDETDLVKRLESFDVVVAMRERTPFPAGVLSRLPNLKLLITTGGRNASIDMAAAKAQGIVVSGTRGHGSPTVEVTWGLVLAVVKSIPIEDRAAREGRWQTTIGPSLEGKTLGLVGLGNLGSKVASVGKAFGMNLVAWSQNLTEERAAQFGCQLVSKEDLLAQADIVTIHLVLSDRTRGLISAADLLRMKPTAYLINTSRGPIVDEQALAQALQERRIAGAGLDVFSEEPLPAGHPFLALDNVVLTPHIGYVSSENYRVYYADILEDILGFLQGQPVRVVGG